MRDTVAINIDAIDSAARRLEPYIHRTPLLSSRSLSDLAQAELRFKAEHLQRTGSFKIRGALNKLLLHADQAKQAGVVAFSSGNHAQGVALAAQLIGASATIVMPSDAPPVKLEATKRYGATLVLCDRYKESREAIADEIATRTTALLVPPFDDAEVIAGQGTLGLEILNDWPEVDVVILPVGGGGLLAGTALALKSKRPQVAVIGVEPALANDAQQSLAAGRIVRIAQPRTIADGVATPALGTLPFAIIQRHVDAIVTVSEEEIWETLLLVLTRMKQVIEPSGALATAAALFAATPVKGRRVVSLFCEGNLDLDLLKNSQAD